MAIVTVSDSIVKNLPNELLNAVKDLEKSSLDTDIFSTGKEGTAVDFRSLIDRLFPVAVVIDYDDILLELHRYITSNMPEVTESKQAKSYSGSLDSIILEAVKTAVKMSKSNAKGISSTELELNISSIVNNNSLSSVQKTQELKVLFNTTYYFTDSNSIVNNSDIFIIKNFEGIRSRISNNINKALGSNIKFGDLLNFGHSAIGKVGGDTYFNSPKNMAVLFDVSTTSASSFISKRIDLHEATERFVTRTKQLDHTIEIEKSFSGGFFSIFVSIGGSVTTIENAAYNQYAGRTFEKGEKFGVNKAVMKKLSAAFTQIKNTAVTGLYNNSNLSTIIRSLYKYTSSPSGLDYITHVMVNTISGKPVESFRGKTGKKDSVKVTEKIQIISGSIKGSKKPTVKLRTPKGQFISPISIQRLLNGQLAKQIQQNMGKGNAKAVLNYRTGRFAESAKVTQVSAREGQVEAFYTYMKNPYATFEPGGRQGHPESRDPRKLIERSIRQIAAEIMQSRLRAIPV